MLFANSDVICITSDVQRLMDIKPHSTSSHQHYNDSLDFETDYLSRICGVQVSLTESVIQRMEGNVVPLAAADVEGSDDNAPLFNGSGRLFSKLRCSIMSLEIHLCFEYLPTNSGASRFVWKEFDFEGCDDHEGGKYVWISFAMLCFVLGFPASVAGIWEMFQRYKRGTSFKPNDVFTLNLSIMDSVFLLFIPPGLLNHLFWRSWPFEATWNFIYALSTCGRPLLMACTCVDCYLAVVHPIFYYKRKSLTPRVVIVGIVWTLTFAIGIAFFLCFLLYLTMFSIAPYVIAVIIIGIFDSLILHKLIKSEPGRTNIHPQKQRAVHTLINSLVMTVLSYLPPVLMLVVGQPLISSFNGFLCLIAIPMTITSTLGSTIMPILHLKNQGKLDRFGLGCCKNS
ncbi:hypothetical protein ABVT39_024177 [Epinephelus coioides]